MLRFMIRRGLVLATLSLLVHASPALAQTTQPSVRHLLSVRAVLLGNVDLLGLDLGLDVLDPLALDVGGSVGFLADSGYARLGYSLSLGTVHDAGDRSSTIRLAFLGGPRVGTVFLSSLSSTGWMGIDAVCAVDDVLWLSDHFGIDGQFVGGVTIWVDHPGVPGVPVWANLRVAAGLSF